jgi:predicted ATPase
MDTFVTISGCSGGGKSTLLNALRRRGYATVEEPGRRIVVEELARNGTALPWCDGVAFARRAIALALADRARIEPGPRWVFFDRGLVDAASALEHLTGEPAVAWLGRTHRCNGCVFLTPPWREIFVTDAERRHGFDAAVAEYDRLTADYASLGYDVCIVPKAEPEQRADFVLDTLRRRAPR